MSDTITFRYSPEWQTWTRFAKQPCDCDDPCLDGRRFENPDVPKSVCIDDLISGKHRVWISDYTRRQLEQSVIATFQDWPEERVRERVDAAVEELSRTPPANWIQSNDYWPVHHGDFCRYIGEWDRDHLNREAADGNGQDYLMSIIHEPEGLGDPEGLWIDIETEWAAVYVFECLECGQRIAVDQRF